MMSPSAVDDRGNGKDQIHLLTLPMCSANGDNTAYSPIWPLAPLGTSIVSEDLNRTGDRMIG
jgi:hypothetical protein